MVKNCTSNTLESVSASINQRAGPGCCKEQREEVTWSCCRGELGRGELGEPCPGWEGALGVRYCWVPLLCHSSATAVPLSCHCHCCAPLLPQLCHCLATAPRLSPLCRCPMVTAMVGWLLAHLPVPLLGSVVPRCAPWLCCSCSPGAVSCVQLCPPQSPHRAHPGDSSWRQELLKDLCKSR